MAYLAVNKDGTEVIGDNLVRGYYTLNGSLVLEGVYFNMRDCKYTHWIYLYYDPDEGAVDITIVLPKGTIQKLIGRELTFEDVPVEI